MSRHLAGIEVPAIMAIPVRWRMTMDEKTFKRNPRDYAIELAESIGWESVCRALLASMSYDDIRECLDLNELSPRFNEDEDSESDNESEENDDE